MYMRLSFIFIMNYMRVAYKLSVGWLERLIIKQQGKGTPSRDLPSRYIA